MPHAPEMRIDSDGLFLHLWRVNRSGERVYPCLVRRRGESEAALLVTFTSSRDDYRSMSLDEFLDELAAGRFANVGRMRMKAPTGDRSANGFAIRKADLTSDLEAELLRRSRSRRNE